jgi:DNA-binding MurR/RpiR family transcriptional regulator
MAASIMQSTGADAYFALVVDATLRKLRVAMAAPAPGSDQKVDAEFETARKQLGKFYVEYQQGYADLLLKHLDPVVLAEAAALLGSKAAVAYFGAVRNMDAELARLFDEMGSRMLQHARYRTAG